MRHYSMVFNTTYGSRRTIRVNNPSADLPLADIEVAVEQIIQNDVFDDARGGLESLSRMELTTIERSVII